MMVWFLRRFELLSLKIRLKLSENKCWLSSLLMTTGVWVSTQQPGSWQVNDSLQEVEKECWDFLPRWKRWKTKQSCPHEGISTAAADDNRHDEQLPASFWERRVSDRFITSPHIRADPRWSRNWAGSWTSSVGQRHQTQGWERRKVESVIERNFWWNIKEKIRELLVKNRPRQQTFRWLEIHGFMHLSQ